MAQHQRHTGRRSIRDMRSEQHSCALLGASLLGLAASQSCTGGRRQKQCAATSQGAACADPRRRRHCHPHADTMPLIELQADKMTLHRQRIEALWAQPMSKAPALSAHERARAEPLPRREHCDKRCRLGTALSRDKTKSMPMGWAVARGAAASTHHATRMSSVMLSRAHPKNGEHAAPGRRGCLPKARSVEGVGIGPINMRSHRTIG